MNVLLWISVAVLCNVVCEVTSFAAVPRNAECHTEEIPAKIVVTTIEDWPFYRQNKEVGKEVCSKSEGFITELVEKVADQVGFEYEFKKVKDSKFGFLGTDGVWTGLIGEVQRKEADMAAAPLTMTSKRLSAVDFSLPFMAVGVVIVYKRPGTGEDLPFKTAEELATAGIPFGVVNTGSTMKAFESSRLPLYNKLWRAMRRHGPSVFVNSYAEGIEKVRAGNYAFIMESDQAERYSKSRPCDLVMVGEPMMTRFFGFATRIGSPLQHAVSSALLQLRENGDIEEMRRRWWKDECEDAA